MKRGSIRLSFVALGDNFSIVNPLRHHLVTLLHISFSRKSRARGTNFSMKETICLRGTYLYDDGKERIRDPFAANFLLPERLT